MLLKNRPKKRTIILNILAEFSASIIFSLLYFIFISRHLSEEYPMNFIMLSYAIGLSFFAAVYIPFHTYRIHILPFISIINALRKKQWRILWHKIPAQISGAYAGVKIFTVINSNTININIESIQRIHLNDMFLTALLNAMLAGVLCYGFYVIRVLFKQRRLTGTVFLGMLITILFAFSGNIAGLSALNPFGLLFYDLSGPQTIKNYPLLEILLIHIISPVLTTLIVYFYMNDMFKSRYKKQTIFQSETYIKNYDI